MYIAYLPGLAIPRVEDAIRRFVARAEALGVRRMVLLSGRGELEGYGCERILQQADIEWTIVRAAWFMQDFSEGDFVPMVQAGTIALPLRNDSRRA